ncbi:uncharacterized protein LOC114530095 [Dendronephthya gigantea]|uniref:uncharacterized protein LOC114530095 n=1 Tax=Dendronephthya gigantea TaxID=151771 RepID=UPI00106AF835|nr:uncharacterized protein LOC114530095 [Dendronephthya gigantea]
MSYTSYLPDQVHREALDFQRVAKRLSARGRKYLSIAANIAAMKYKQINLEMQRDLAKRQSDRLRTLKTTVIQKDITDNAANTTDLFEIGTIIKMRENQVRTHLVQSFGFMDAALQYYYFQKPTVIKRYDTLSIQRAAAKQVQSSITILERFPSAPENVKRPIEYNIPGVRVQELLSPDGCEKEIKLSSVEFQNYIRVRILRVEVRADNIANVSNDEAYIEATASGESFQDRDLKRNPISFSTAPKSYRFTYNIVTKEAIVTSQPSSDFDSKFIKMTPFDKWVFRLPNVTTNKDLRFSSELTTLRIKFYVNAIFDPPRLSSRRRRIRRSDVSGSKHDLLQRINGRSLVRNWDAIMAVSAERVNQIWKQQYDNQTKAGFVKSIATERTVDSDYGFMITYARCFLEVGPPKIQFIEHNHNEVALTFEIKSGKVEFTLFKRIKGRIPENAFNVLNHTINRNAAVTAIVRLTQIKGRLTNESLVVLDLSTAIVIVPHLFNGDSTEFNLATQIRTFFAKRLSSRDFEVARITYEDALTPRSLVPDRFYLATGGFKPDGSGTGSLYIFFRTHFTSSSATVNTPRDFNDPITIDRQVIPNGYEVVLFINNRIIFGDIMVKDIKKKLSFSVQTKDFPGMTESQQSKYVVGVHDAKYHFSLRAQAGKVDVSISARKFKVRSSNRGKKIKVTWEVENQPIRIPYYVEKCAGRVMYKCWNERRTKTKNFDVNFVKYYKPNIDQAQTITYTGESATVNVDSDSVSGWDIFWNSGTSLRRAKRKIESKLRNYLEKLDFNFRDISTFAITQVLFPNQDVFQLEEVYIPGDMVIFGRVKTKKTK